MNTYLLKRKKKDIDVIMKFSCDDYDTACEYFAEIKKLPVEELLKIYVVVLS
jgi:hypothetical protein